eukprot:403337496
MKASMIATPKGQAGTFLMVDSEVDLTYFKRMLDDTKKRMDDVSFIEKRAVMANSDTSLEDELTMAYDEIKKNERELKQLLSVAEFLFENREDLNTRLDFELQTVDDLERQIFGYKQRSDAILEELDQKTKIMEHLNKEVQQYEAALLIQKEDNSKMKKKFDEHSQQLEIQNDKMAFQIEKIQELEECQGDASKYYQLQIQELETKLFQYKEQSEKQNLQNDEKDLEISRLRRENEELSKSKKTTSEKIMEYQSINERLRKDKTTLDEQVAELNKKIQMIEMLQNSAQMVMGRGGDFDEEVLNNSGGGGLGGELKDFEDMDGSFNGGELYNGDIADQNSSLQGSRKGTVTYDLNQSINSDNQEQFQQNLQANVSQNVASTQDAQINTQVTSNLHIFNNTDVRRQSSLLDPATLAEATKILMQNEQFNPKPVGKVEFETQTESLQVTEKKLQTDATETSNSSIQTDKLESKSFQSQTLILQSSDASTQYEDRLIELQAENLVIIQSIIKEINSTIITQQPQQQKRSSKIMMKPKGLANLQLDSEETSESQEMQQNKQQQMKQVPATEKAENLNKKFDLTQSEFENLKTAPSIQTPSSKSSSFLKDQFVNEYMLNRDPLKEFFTLCCQSVKLNSPHMNIICTLNQNILYDKATKENIPFFKWYNWIEQTINKEVLSSIFKDKSKTSQKRPATVSGLASNAPPKQNPKVQKTGINQVTQETLIKQSPNVQQKQQIAQSQVQQQPPVQKKTTVKPKTFGMF